MYRPIIKSLLTVVSRLLGVLIALPVAGGLLTGCDHSSLSGDDPQPAHDGKWVYMTLDVKTNEPVPAARLSRADDTGYYFEEPQRANEKLHNLAVVITDTGDNVEASRCVSYSGAGTILYDNLTFQLRPGQKKVYLIGNYLSLPEEVQAKFTSLNVGDKLDDLFAITLSRGQNQHFYSLTDNIPMTECFDVTLTGDTQYVTKELFVTRIAVKYTIQCTRDMRLQKMKLYNLATSQYLMPVDAVYDPEKKDPPMVINGIAGRNIVEFKSPAPTAGESSSNVAEITLTGEKEVTDENGNKFYRYDPIYLMESPGTSFHIAVEAAFGNGEQSETMWLPKPEGASQGVPAETNGKLLYNLPLLPRNTHVLINMSVKADLTCDVRLVPYKGVWLNATPGILSVNTVSYNSPDNGTLTATTTVMGDNDTPTQITLADSTKVADGTVVNFKAEAANGYAIESLTVNGVEVENDADGKTLAGQKSAEVEVTVNEDTDVVVSYMGSQTVRLVYAKHGYTEAYLTNPVPPEGEEAPAAIANADKEHPEYGVFHVTPGTKIWLKSKAEPGYVIDQIKVGGTIVTGGSDLTEYTAELTTSATATDIDIEVTFKAAPTVTLTYDMGTGGSISIFDSTPQTLLNQASGKGSITVRIGTVITVKIHTSQGYILDSFNVDEENQTLQSVYNVTVTQDMTFNATFKKKSSPVYFSVITNDKNETNGTLECYNAEGAKVTSGTYFEYGTPVTFKVKADSGYFIAELRVKEHNGNTYTTDEIIMDATGKSKTSYEFTMNVTNYTEVIATFSKS